MVEKDEVSKDFRKQVLGYGLTTAEIVYRRADRHWLLQTYVWQKVPKGDLSKREVHYVSQVVSKNCRPKCPGSAVQHHQQATYHHSLANIPETRPPVIGSKQKRCCENQGIAVIQIALEQMTRTAAEYDLLT